MSYRCIVPVVSWCVQVTWPSPAAASPGRPIPHARALCSWVQTWVGSFHIIPWCFHNIPWYFHDISMIFLPKSLVIPGQNMSFCWSLRLFRRVEPCWAPRQAIVVPFARQGPLTPNSTSYQANECLFAAISNMHNCMESEFMYINDILYQLYFKIFQYMSCGSMWHSMWLLISFYTISHYISFYHILYSGVKARRDV